MRAKAGWLWALLLPAAAFGEERSLTVERAVELALSGSPRVQAAKAQLEAAQSGANSLRGRMLPGLYLSDEQQHWDSPYALAFSLPGAPAGTPAPVFPIRAINTNTLAIAARQPVLGLVHISQDYAALLQRADAAQADLRAAEAAVREEVQSDFLRVFEARALADIARASEQQLNEQVAVAKSKLQAGVLTQADVLRIQVAAANARQQEIQADAQEEVARLALQEAIGMPLEGGVTLAEPTVLEAVGQAPPALQPAVEQALAQRPELEGARLQAGAAHAHARAKAFSLLPEVNLEAGYSHVHGQSFAPENSGFVGLKVDWPIFEWGASWYDSREASAQAAAADANVDGTRRRVRTEVASRLAQVRAALSAVDSAQAAVAAAEEAYRVTQALVNAGSATTTDLLDAQAALSQARLNLVRARYAHAQSRVALARATGG